MNSTFERVTGVAARLAGRRGGVRALASAALVLAFVDADALASCAQAQERGPGSYAEAFYVVRGRRVELTLELDRAGLVLAERGADKEFFEALLQQGLERAGTYRDLLHVVDPPGEPARAELTRLVFDLLQQKGVLHAGLVATSKGGTQPLLILHEAIVRFADDVAEEAVRGLLEELDLRVVERSAFTSNLWLVAMPPGGDLDALEACRLLSESPLVDYAEPNVVQHVEHLADPPDDPYFAKQWHLHNDGHGGGTVDADIDAPQAWELSSGTPDTVIALLEDGFDTAHPDLVPNFWTDPATGAPGASFAGDPSLVGDADREATAHGTAVAGCAAARANNGIGTAGSCPDCSLMLVRRGLTAWKDAKAIGWAAAQGADVISNSWTYGLWDAVPQVVSDTITAAANRGRDGRGCVVLFGVRNVETETVLASDIARHPDVIAVGSITNTDEKVTRCGWGSCLSVLGPSRYNRSSSTAVGTLNVSTTDWCSPANGFNADPMLQVAMTAGFAPCAELDDTSDYTSCFGGTSAATPIVAGVAGLVLSADPELTSREVRRLLQDTADRAHDSAGVYDDVNGYSTTRYHGNGRVNAFEAVRVVAAAGKGGRGGVDVFVRDNRLDWGNTEQPSSMLFEPVRARTSPFQSVDIKVDASPLAAAITDAAAFEAFADEDPRAGRANRVLVRVRNRGPRPATDVKVALYVGIPPDVTAPTGGSRALPPLPAGFWAAFDASSAASAPQAPGSPPLAAGWFLAGVVELGSLAYCGPSIAGTADDAAAIATFQIEVPELLGGLPREFPLLVLVDCAADPLSQASRGSQLVRQIVPNDNNATLRWVTLRP